VAGDGRLVLVGDSTGEAIWTSTDVEVVASAVRFYDMVWAAAEPGVPPGMEPPFTRRMIDIAFHLIDGATDREIARALGVSERTVSSDVREMSNRIGARSRAQAIALISGI
jgi:DNA-binding NarL/FixJ family response regulator